MSDLEGMVRRYVEVKEIGSLSLEEMYLLDAMFKVAQGEDSELAKAVRSHYWADLAWAEINFTTPEEWDKSDMDLKQTFQNLVDLVS